MAAALFMFNLDSTIIVTALPEMAADFGVEPLGLSIGITSYLLAGTSTLMVSGWLSQKWGSQKIFLAALALFTVSSVLCAGANSLSAFVVLRALEGFGGGLIVPVGRLIVLTSTPNTQLLRAVATITWPALIAPVIAPPLGGLITMYSDWRWIFLINLPIGMGVFTLAKMRLPDRRAASPRPFDMLGFFLGSGGLTLIIAGLENIALGAKSWLLGLVLVGSGLILAIFALRHYSRFPTPLVDLSPLRYPSFAASTLGAGALFRLAISAAPFLLPLALQIGMGIDAFASGLFLLVYMSGNLAMKSVTTPILRRFGFRSVLFVNGIAVAISLAAMALTSIPNVALVGAILFGAGLVRSMQFTSLATLSFCDVPQDMRVDATALSSTTQQISQTLGISVAAMIVTLAQTVRGGISPMLIDFQIAFIIFGAIALVAVIAVFQLPADAGAEVTGKQLPAVSKRKDVE